MSKNERNIKTESELQKLIEDTRKLRSVVKPVYNPTALIVINGMEVANYQVSGFPKFNDIKRFLEFCIPKYKPIEVVVDSSLRYLIPEEELEEFEETLKNGIIIKNVRIPFIEVSSNEKLILTLLKHALDNNAKVLSNQNLLESYEIIKQQKLKSLENKKFQAHFTITNDEITIFE